ncbi:MAG: SH3 domain-containing protein [Lachnospiraceae bacterium]|jgi:cell wall-associated NlpC family hydrolase|nr:SH3 domain-containing protein [Lachnospiraceae bacterium]MCI8986136.1 SH3 domain-containing protein [Lachnospiraceae bacterium]MCI9015427.1 SH3 domain-containing protein [Lachnospiraceae bacterium]
MKMKNVRIAACAITAVLAFSGMGMDAWAVGSVSSVLPSAGIDFSMQDQEKTTALSSLQEESEKEAARNAGTDGASVGSVQVGGFADMASTDNKVSAAHSRKIEDTVVVSEGYTRDLKENTGLTEEEEGFKKLVIARVNDYVNVRDLPSEEGNIVGKLYNKSVGNFIEEENGWYKIKSGSVEGYVKGEYCVTGDEAVDYAKEVGTRIATVTTTTLKVREQPGLEETVLGLVPIEDELIVTEELDGWVKVNIEEGDGYVSNEYVTLSTEFVKAESIEEERARLEKEEAARRAAQEAANKKMASNKASSSSQTTDGGKTYQNPTGSSGSDVVKFAMQFVGNPYVYGGTSLTNGADCSGFVMSVYNNFGVSLPHSSAADRNVGAAVNGIENAQPGDIVCYSGHVGIYAGNGQLVHASTSKTGIIVSSATYRPILSIRRIF